MTPGDVVRVLTACAMFDYRHVSEADAAAWHAVLGDLDVADALEAVRRHYRDSTDRAMPAHIRRQVRGIREERRKATSDALGLPSPYEPDMGRQVRMDRGMAGCRTVLAALGAHWSSKAPPPVTAMERLREITAGPAWASDQDDDPEERP